MERENRLRGFVGLRYEAVNCWQLVVALYREFFDIELKHLYDGDIPDRETRRALIFSKTGEFELVADTPQFGDIVILKIRGIESHIGFVVNKRQFIHSINGTGSCIEPLDRWRPNIAGIYRHRRAA